MTNMSHGTRTAHSHISISKATSLQSLILKEYIFGQSFQVRSQHKLNLRVRYTCGNSRNNNLLK